MGGHESIALFLIAAKKGHLEIIQLLVQAGANHLARAESGATALDVARAYKQIAVMEYLEGLAAD